MQVAEAIQLMIRFRSLLISLIGLIVVLLELHSKNKK
ncbi:putative holin-like toxin [Listeria costaricensis]